MFFESHGGSNARYGRLLFKGIATPREWIVVSTQTSPSLLITFLHKTWKLTKPAFVLSVSGGAQNFSLSARQ